MILITTKKGKAGDTKVNIKISEGKNIGQVRPLPGFVEYATAMLLRAATYANDGVGFSRPLVKPCRQITIMMLMGFGTQPVIPTGKKC